MSGTMNLLIGLAMGLSLLALASSRLPSVIRAAAFQGMILGTLPLLLEEKFHWLVVAVAIGTITVRVSSSQTCCGGRCARRTSTAKSSR